jgi:predicted O-methyltransferase YrrM
MPGRPYTFFQLAIRYLRYYFTAMNSRGHGIHSPFVYAFVRKVLLDKQPQPAFGPIEQMRARLLKDPLEVSLTDYGAGSGSGLEKRKTIGHIARTAAKPAYLAQLLFRTASYFNALVIVELGSSLALTTAYLASWNSKARVYSLEGDPALARIARKNLDSLGLNNAEIITGNFDDQLQPLLNRLTETNLVYIDGNHRLEPTLRYFEQALAAAGPETVIILDDIHWSAEMEDAWAEIREHPAVTATIDIFFLGYVFLRPEFKERQHFSIRYR